MVARCCVRVMACFNYLGQPGVALAEHQDDFSGFTCIGYRIFLWGAVRPRAAHNIIPKSANGRDAESTEDAEVR